MTNSPLGRAAWRAALPVLLFALPLPPAYGRAQQQTTTLRVTVTDQAGKPAARVSVTATNRATREPFKEETNEEGVAVFDALPPGSYEVTVESPELKVLARESVEMTATAVRMIRLNVPPLAEPAVDTREALSALPNVNNDLTPLLQTVPGAVATGPSSLGRVIVDGRGNDQQTSRLDGVDSTPQVDFPAADAAIAAASTFQKPEVAGDLDGSATRSGAFGYEARYGPGSGSVSEVPTFKADDAKDVWRAQLYGDHRNDALNARNFFDHDGENALRRSRFGAKASGPVPFTTKPAFLFLAYEGLRGRVERNVYEAIPADAVTGAAAGPLAPHLRAYLPPGTHLAPDVTADNSDFVIARRRNRTTARSDAWDVRLDYYPFRQARTVDCAREPGNDQVQPFPPQTVPAGEPATPPTVAAPEPLPTRECGPLTLRFTHQTVEHRVPDGVTGRSQRQRFFFANALVGFQLIRDRKRVNDEFKPGRNFFGHFFRFGFNLTRAHLDTETVAPTSSDLAQSLITIGSTVRAAGLPLAAVDPPGQLPTITVASLGGLVSGAPGRGLDLKPVSYTAAYDYSRKVGENNELYAGFESRFIRLDFNHLGGLTYNFPNVAALRAGTPGRVTFQSDLSGPSPFSEGSGRRRAVQNYYMGYFQMVSQFGRSAAHPTLEPSVTLTYGLRYDYFDRVRERGNRAVVVDPSTGDILPRGTPFYRVDRANLQPRVGVAYRPANEGVFRNTVFRAGFGVYSGVPRISDLAHPIRSDRFSTGIEGGTFPSTPAEAVSAFVANPDDRLFQPIAFARDFSPLERVVKWDFKVGHTQYGYEFSAYYLGSVGRNLGLANFANRIVSVATNPDPTKTACVVREFDIVTGPCSVDRPFGEFFYLRGGGRSSLNVLTLQMARVKKDSKLISEFFDWLKIPVDHFNAKYTLSRSLGNASGTIMSNPLDPDADFGYNAGVARHSFTLSLSYNVWQRPGVTEPPSADLLRGWRISPSLKVSSGLPLIVRIKRPDVVYVDADGNVFASPGAGRAAVLNTPGGGSSGDSFVPNFVPGADPYTRGSADRLYLDPAAFAIPAPGRLGDVRRGQFRGPGVVQLDLALRRNFRISRTATEKSILGEFQVDFYNIFNRTNFSNPTALLPGLLGIDAAQQQLQPGVPITRDAGGRFGVISAADNGRQIQFSLTLKFNGGFTK